MHNLTNTLQPAWSTFLFFAILSNTKGTGLPYQHLSYICCILLRILVSLFLFLCANLYWSFLIVHSNEYSKSSSLLSLTAKFVITRLLFSGKLTVRVATYYFLIHVEILGLHVLFHNFVFYVLKEFRLCM